MKKILSAASFAVLLTSCNDTVEKLADFSKPQLRDAISGEETNASTAIDSPFAGSVKIGFPTEQRTLTDVNGRSINARILAKKGNMIAIARMPSNQRFVLPLDKLANADRVSLSSVRDGGELGAFGATAQDGKLPANRRAVWHSQISSAENEALKYGIPMFVAVLVNGSSAASDLEKNLAYSSEFKTWADRNVVLCMIQTDGFAGRDSRDTTYETWMSLQRFGIDQSNDSSLVLIDPTQLTKTKIESRGEKTSEKLIALTESAIEKQSRWRRIRMADAPVRADSPFKVAGGARFTGGGGGGSGCSSGSS